MSAAVPFCSQRHQACGGLANGGAQRRSVVLLAQGIGNGFVNFFRIEAPCGANCGQRNLRGVSFHHLKALSAAGQTCSQRHQACSGLANGDAQRRSVVLLAQGNGNGFVNFFRIEAPCGAKYGQRNLRGVSFHHLKAPLLSYHLP